MEVVKGWGEREKRGVATQNVWSFSYTRWVASRDLLHCIVPVVSKTVLCAPKFVESVDVTLSVPTSVAIRERKGQEECFGADGYVWHLACGGSVAGLVICQNSSRAPSPSSVCSFSACQLHLSKTIKIDLSAEIGQDCFAFLYHSVSNLFQSRVPLSSAQVEVWGRLHPSLPTLLGLPPCSIALTVVLGVWSEVSSQGCWVSARGTHNYLCTYRILFWRQL